MGHNREQEDIPTDTPTVIQQAEMLVSTILKMNSFDFSQNFEVTF
jgi:hypothetical protein